ncbi:hypothetical protein PENTCL1PPCAC_29637, partial [Pristionchus entomophagus]
HSTSSIIISSIWATSISFSFSCSSICSTFFSSSVLAPSSTKYSKESESSGILPMMNFSSLTSSSTFLKSSSEESLFSTLSMSRIISREWTSPLISFRFEDRLFFSLLPMSTANATRDTSFSCSESISKVSFEIKKDQRSKIK